MDATFAVQLPQRQGKRNLRPCQSCKIRRKACRFIAEDGSCSACKKLNLACIEGSMPKSRRNSSHSMIEEFTNISDAESSPIPAIRTLEGITPSLKSDQDDCSAKAGDSGHSFPPHQGKGRTIASIMNDCHQDKDRDEVVSTSPKSVQKMPCKDPGPSSLSFFGRPDDLQSMRIRSKYSEEFPASEGVSPLGVSYFHFGDLVLRAITCQSLREGTYVLSYCIVSNLSASRQYPAPECPVNSQLEQWKNDMTVLYRRKLEDIQSLDSYMANQLRGRDTMRYHPETWVP